jgi:hypothetical protein
MQEENSNCSLMMSAIVSVAAEKAGGDSVQPIGRRVGTATRGGSDGRLGKGTASSSALLGVSGSW